MNNKKTPKIIMISIDSLDPGYIKLNSSGNGYSAPGDYLMPNVVKFIKGGTCFENARCHMPAATDMNHVNAVSGANTSQTGINLVSFQLFDWNDDGTPNMVSTSLSFARDENGNEVDTLFKAWKRKWPYSKTMIASGKEWVANMFKTEKSGVDLFLGGTTYPGYISPPEKGYKFYNPNNKKKVKTSGIQKMFSILGYEKNPSHFPPDKWIVESSLKMLNQEHPDFSLIILAQCDDAQHAFGTANNLDDFDNNNSVKNVCKYNKHVYKDPVIETIKDIDKQVGILIDGIKKDEYYKDAVIVLYSDHSHITLRENHTVRDIIRQGILSLIFPKLKINPKTNTDIFNIIQKEKILTKEEKKYKNVCLITGGSMGLIYFKNDDYQKRYEKAKEWQKILMKHQVYNNQQKKHETPWYIISIDEAMNGIPGVCEPGELFHKYFGYNNEPGKLHWPDLFIFAKNGWQLPVFAGYAGNLGVKINKLLAKLLPPFNALLGGHGAQDSVNILLSFQGPGIKKNKIIIDPMFKKNYRISDIAVTLLDLLGLRLKSVTVGKNRLKELYK